MTEIHPDTLALEIIHNNLTEETRRALAHLLNNALCPVVMEASSLRNNRTYVLRETVKHLRKVVAKVLADPAHTSNTLLTP